MSDVDEESNPETSSDEEYVQTDANLYPPTQPVHQNQVLELVHHNNKLQTTLRTSTSNLQSINRNIFSYYYRLRDSCRKLQGAYEHSQRTITQLQVDKYNLSRKLLGPDLQKLSLDPENPSDENEECDAVYDDTVNSLQRQLRISERDKQQVIQSYQAERAQWQNHYAKLQERWNAREDEWRQYANTIREEYDTRAYQTQLEHYKEVVDRDNTIDTLKCQTTMLLQDAEEQRKVLSSTEESLKAVQSQCQDKELRILNLSKDIEAKDKSLRDKDDHSLSLRQELERSVATRKDKEKSLEQLVRLYNELQAENSRLMDTVKNHSEERDKIYAQYVCADESLKKKAEETNELKRQLEEAETRDNVSVYMRQAEIFQNDFRMEREARQKLHQEYERLRAECDRLNGLVIKYDVEMQRMKQDLMRCHDMMRNRNGIHS